MVTGAPPFDAPTPIGVVSKHLTDPVPDPRISNPKINSFSVVLINRLMAKKKEDRFPSWTKAIWEMDRLLESIGGAKREFDIFDEQEIYNDSVEYQRRSSVLKKLSVKISPLLKMLDWKKSAALVVTVALLALCLFALMGKNMKNIQKNKAEKIYSQAISLSAKNNPADRTNIIEMLEAVIKTGDPEYSALARKSMDEIQNKIIREKEIIVEKRKTAAMDILKKQSYALESAHDYKKAMELWEQYSKNGEYRDDSNFKNEIRRALEYLKNKKKAREAGIDE